MKRKSTTIMIFTALTFLAIWTVFLSGCAKKNENGRDVVYEDMKDSFERSGLFSANIGLFAKTEKDGSISYGECGSGVIFEKKDEMYYALTAAHVVSAGDAQMLVFTTNTEMKTEDIPGLENMNVLTRDTYESMYSAEVVFVSKRDDLAVIRFSTDEELAVIELASSDPVKEDRILCVGNPLSEWFVVSYGKVTSGIEKFGEYLNFPSNVMKHSAYIQVGSSGGAAIDEQMKLAGITPGASLSLDGKTFKYGVLIPVSEIRHCLDEWKE